MSSFTISSIIGSGDSSPKIGQLSHSSGKCNTAENIKNKSPVQATAREILIEKLVDQSHPPLFSPLALAPFPACRMPTPEPCTLYRSLSTDQKVEEVRKNFKRQAEDELPNGSRMKISKIEKKEESAVEKKAKVARIYPGPLTVHADCFKEYLDKHMDKYHQKMKELRELLFSGEVTSNVLYLYHFFSGEKEVSVRQRLNKILREIIECHHSNYSLAFTSCTKNIPWAYTGVGPNLRIKENANITAEFWEAFVANIVVPTDINEKMWMIGLSISA